MLKPLRSRLLIPALAALLLFVVSCAAVATPTAAPLPTSEPPPVTKKAVVASLTA